MGDDAEIRPGSNRKKDRGVSGVSAGETEAINAERTARATGRLLRSGSIETSLILPDRLKAVAVNRPAPSETFWRGYSTETTTPFSKTTVLPTAA
jgi:hypothetical protein